MPEALGIIFGVLGVFGSPIAIVYLWTRHRQKMAEINKGGGGSGSVHLEIEALRSEIRSLRDTTMQYDLSFDTALQRLEGRMENTERRLQAGEADQNVELQIGR